MSLLRFPLLSAVLLGVVCFGLAGEPPHVSARSESADNSRSPSPPGLSQSPSAPFSPSLLSVEKADQSEPETRSQLRGGNHNTSSAGVSKVMPIWKALLLLYHSIDADYTDSDGIPRHLTYALSQNEILDGIWTFRQFASIANDFSNAEAFVQYDILHITRPINSLTQLGTNAWWVSPNDIRQELDIYAPSGAYDSVLVLWPQANYSTGQQIPPGYWGLALPASSWSNGATYAALINVPTWMWNIPTVGEPWLHEWLHGVCPFYENKGYPMPSGNADGGGSHGYVSSPTTGWASYYRDLMTGNVLESGTHKGVTPYAWRSGTILTTQKKQVLADYFYADTTSYYQRTGTVVWQNIAAKEQYITLGTSAASDNKMYTAENLHDKATVTGRLHIPATGVGNWDTVAVALRNDQVEYWATLAYGTQLVERNHISIIRNNVWGTLHPLSLTSGWYTVKVSLDYQGNVMQMKAWADTANEPAWQVSTALDPGWQATQVGFRHYGQGARADDLLVIQDVSQGIGRIYLPALLR